MSQRTRPLRRVPRREQSAAEQHAAILATGNAASPPREIMRVECACETMLGPQSIVEIDSIQVGWQHIARMACYCLHCDVILMFNLVIDEATGLRQFTPVMARRRYRGQAAIDRFLSRYPQARGLVIQ